MSPTQSVSRSCQTENESSDEDTERVEKRFTAKRSLIQVYGNDERVNKKRKSGNIEYSAINDEMLTINDEILNSNYEGSARNVDVSTRNDKVSARNDEDLARNDEALARNEEGSEKTDDSSLMPPGTSFCWRASVSAVKTKGRPKKNVQF